MLGLGETRDEVIATLRDLRSVDRQRLTLGQYLRPSLAHLPVDRYWHPDEFDELGAIARELGFAVVRSGPLARSSLSRSDLTPAIQSLRLHPLTAADHQCTGTAPHHAQGQIPQRSLHLTDGFEAALLEITHQTAMLALVITDGQQPGPAAWRDLQSPGHRCSPNQVTTTRRCSGENTHGVELQTIGTAVSPGLHLPQQLQALRLSTSNHQAQAPQPQRASDLESQQQIPLTRFLLQLIQHQLSVEAGRDTRR